MLDQASWHLIAPDYAALDALRRAPIPFVLWPICEKPLLAWWLDEAVRQGVPTVRIEALDRPHLIRRWLDARDFWSRSIEVEAQAGAAAAGAEVITIDGLPGMTPQASPPQSPDALLRYWFALHEEALRRRSTGMVHLDHEFAPGVWLGPGTRIAADVVFTPPCWVGSMARISNGCRIGPAAFIGPGAFIDKDVEITASIVCADTYVGAHTSLTNVAVQGGMLMDLALGVVVDVTDRFVLDSTNRSAQTPGWFERVFAAVATLPLEGLAWLAARGQNPSVCTFQLGRSKNVSTRTFPKGPLCLRRASWLRLVAAGHLRIVGILPRPAENWDTHTAETRACLEQFPAGVFALSDLYDCHFTDCPEEWIHAVYQAGSPDGVGQQLAWNSLIKIALTIPAR